MEQSLQNSSVKTHLDNIPLHTQYFKRCLQMLPNVYVGADSNRMTLLYFTLSALDLMGTLDKALSKEDIHHCIEWVYAQQYHSNKNESDDESIRYSGFRGSPLSGLPFNSTSEKMLVFDSGHLAMTYTALLILVILGDDLSRVDKEGIIASLKHLQQPDGSFTPFYGGSECDMRFLFTACAICFILNDWQSLDRSKAVEFIRSCQTYDYAMGQAPGQESHGGSTYCAVAALKLMNEMDVGLLSKQDTIKWCLNRQGSGFHGRANKPEDTCYSFWIGGSLELLDSYHLIDFEANSAFLAQTCTKYGGFGKHANSPPDLLHAYMGIAGLSIGNEAGYQPINCALNLSVRAVDFLKAKTRWWQN